MKDLKERLDEIVGNFKLKTNFGFAQFLTEADDFGGDDAAGGDDPFASGGDDDPFAAGGDDAGADDGDMGGGAPAGGSNSSTGDKSDSGSDDENKTSPIDDDSHEDDPDFTVGKNDNGDVTLSEVPAGKMLYDTEKVMNTVAAVIQTLKDTQLVEIEKVKTAIELVFNGKKLKDEDLKFTNLKNAIFIIKKIGVKLDTKTRNYLYRKIKEPLIKQRDQIKQDIAVKKGELQNAREVLTAMDIK